MKMGSEQTVFRLSGEESLGDTSGIEIRRDTMGEPFREGLLFTIRRHDTELACFLEKHEAARLRDYLKKMLPE